MLEKVCQSVSGQVLYLDQVARTYHVTGSYNELVCDLQKDVNSSDIKSQQYAKALLWCLGMWREVPMS